MRIPTARLLFCLAASGLVTSCATANSGTNPTPTASAAPPQLSNVDKSFLRGINSYDLNRDDVVTCDEWRKAMTDMFTKANKSRSGFLTEEEYRNLAQSDRTFLTASLKYYDVNNDGKVDKTEFVDRPNPAFTYADADKDCRLTEPELTTVRKLSTPPAPSAPRATQISNGSPGGPGTIGPGSSTTPVGTSGNGNGY